MIVKIIEIKNNILTWIRNFFTFQRSYIICSLLALFLMIWNIKDFKFGFQDFIALTNLFVVIFLFNVQRNKNGAEVEFLPEFIEATITKEYVRSKIRNIKLSTDLIVYNSGDMNTIISIKSIKIKGYDFLEKYDPPKHILRPILKANEQESYHFDYSYKNNGIDVFDLNIKHIIVDYCFSKKNKIEKRIIELPVMECNIKELKH